MNLVNETLYATLIHIFKGHTPLILACVKGYPIEAEEINSPSKRQNKDVDATNAYRTKIVSMLLEQGLSMS